MGCDLDQDVLKVPRWFQGAAKFENHEAGSIGLFDSLSSGAPGGGWGASVHSARHDSADFLKGLKEVFLLCEVNGKTQPDPQVCVSRKSMLLFKAQGKQRLVSFSLI